MDTDDNSVGKKTSGDEKELGEQETVAKPSAVEEVSDMNNKSDKSSTVGTSAAEIVSSDSTDEDEARDLDSGSSTSRNEESPSSKPTNTDGKKAPTFEPYIGMKFKKKFTIGTDKNTRAEYYAGEIVSGPHTIHNTITGEDDLEWHVQYLDGDEEDLSLEELLECEIILDEYTEGTRRSGRSRKRPTEEYRTFEPFVGMQIRKKFGDGEFYIGTVVSGPEPVLNQKSGFGEWGWRVRYEDDDEEDLGLEELVTCRYNDKKKAKTVTTTATPTKASPPVSKFDLTREALRALPTMTDEEVVAALEKVGPPYGMQAVTEEVHKARDAKNYAEPSSGLFNPEIGMKIRKMFDGRNWYGTVTGDAEIVEEPAEVEGYLPRKVKVWQVTYADGDVDDMTWQELFKYRADRPMRAAPCRGRMLQCLELFSGVGIVSQEFAARNWAICSIDNNEKSNATIKADILDIEPKDLEFVPDFIWASPPCHTYSNMAGGRHRNASKGNLEITEEARHHNFLFARMAKIIEWVKTKHPHMIVVIENPVGQMAKMPLMKEVSDSLGLRMAHVHYCTLGRDDKKPTCLWTNDFGLWSRLMDFRCSEQRCPYYKSGTHPISCRGHGSKFNAAAIPNALAEEVAQYVDAKFYMDRVAYTKAAPPPSWEQTGQTKSWRDAACLDRYDAIAAATTSEGTENEENEQQQATEVAVSGDAEVAQGETSAATVQDN